MSDRTWDFIGNLTENGTRVITGASANVTEATTADASAEIVVSNGKLTFNLKIPSAGISEYSSYLNFPTIGSTRKIYIDTTTNMIYRWDDENTKYYTLGLSSETVTRIDGGTSAGSQS